jgi:hypothetical protein
MIFTSIRARYIVRDYDIHFNNEEALLLKEVFVVNHLTFFLINIGVQISLCTFRLISQHLKLITM